MDVIKNLSVEDLYALICTGALTDECLALAKSRLANYYADFCPDSPFNDSDIPETVMTEQTDSRGMKRQCNDQSVPGPSKIRILDDKGCNAVESDNESSSVINNDLSMQTTHQTGGGFSNTQPNRSILSLISSVERKIRQFNLTGREYTFRVDTNQLGSNFVEAFLKIFSILLNTIPSGFNQTDMVGIQINLAGLDRVIFYPFSRVGEITMSRLLDLFEKIIQSNTKVVLADILVKLVRVVLPTGGGRPKYFKVADFLKKKQSIITVDSKDNLCLGRCISLGLLIGDQTEFKALYRSKKLLTDRAKDLYVKAGVPFGSVSSNDFPLFQKIIKSHQLVVYEGLDLNLIFKGPKFSKQIFILLVENHYYLIKSMTGFLNKSYFCSECLKGYNKKDNHTCLTKCKFCNKSPKCIRIGWINCFDCNRVFPSQTCYDNHKTSTSSSVNICSKFIRCKACYFLLEKGKSHNCGISKCSICRQLAPMDHECYITPPLSKKPILSPIIFFDFECTQDRVLNDNTQIHEVNLCVSKKICKNCVSKFSTTPCPYCERKVFYTEEDFCSYVFQDLHKGVTCLAHYAKAYDNLFIMRYLLNKGFVPNVILTGSKILALEYGGIRFIDTFSFMPMALAKLPQTFGFKEETKGFFPHLFNTRANENYIGAIPDSSFYDPDGMSPTTRSEFFQWYKGQANVIFVMKDEILKYCLNDVNILVKASLIFRKTFYDITKIDPFAHITLAQTCLDVYRSSFMPRNTIANIPDVSTHDKYSIVAIRWLKWIEYSENLTIQHALAGGEAKIGPYRVDGLCGNTVYDFLGCHFHGCVNCKTQRWTEPFKNGLTYQDLYERTVSRRLFLENRGLKVIEIWECEFNNLIKTNCKLREFLAGLDLVEPLNIRDALMGGRVEVFKKYHRATHNQKIKYIDITSLYPYVNKNCLYVTGLPVTIKENFGDLKNYNGFVKCNVLPPKRLFVPLLPSRVLGKLMFVLCRRCAELKCNTCDHTDEERSLTGTFCTPELHKAIDLGYKILKVYEVYHFKTTMKGLFKDYVDAFLKIKQEASGWPIDCDTDEKRIEYIRNYKIHEGIDLDPSKICKNPGLRTIAKLILNCLWGKMGQRNTLPQVEFVNEASRLYELFGNSDVSISAIDIVSDSILRVVHSSKNETCTGRSSSATAAFTTSNARLVLYSYLEKLQERVLYCDTDSIIYTVSENESEIPLGEFLGEMTDELGQGLHIDQFVGIGPKSYGYTLSNGESVMKIKGITLSHRTREVIDFSLLREMVNDAKTNVTVSNPHFITRTTKGLVVSKNQSKIFRSVFDKRRIEENFNTLPWGHM